MPTAHIPARLIPETRALTAAQFQDLSEVPPELEWFANLPNEKTRRAYRLDLTDVGSFIGINRPEEFRLITRAHVIAWR
jgi:integrase/recombinase XerD